MHLLSTGLLEVIQVGCIIKECRLEFFYHMSVFLFEHLGITSLA